jgi:hypothetical protein
MKIINFMIVGAVGLLVPACATTGAANVSSIHGDAVSSANFVLSPPNIYPEQDSVRVSGTVCRKPNRALVTPSHIEIDHLKADHSLIEKTLAYLPPLSRRADQRCGRYTGKTSSAFSPGDTIRVCISRGAGRCPA